MCLNIFSFSLLLAGLCGGAAHAGTVPGPLRLHHNDNSATPECAIHLAPMPRGPKIFTLEDGEVAIEMNREPRLAAARGRLALARHFTVNTRGHELERDVRKITGEFPRLGLSATGGVVVIHRSADHGYRAISSHQNRVRPQAWPRDQAYLDHVDSVSPDGRYVVLSDEDHTRQQMIDTITGEVIIARDLPRWIRQSDGVAMKFSADGRTVTVRREDLVEIFDLKPTPRRLTAYDLGPAEIMITVSDQTGSAHDDFPRDVRGEVHHLTHARALVAFYRVAEPAILRLRRGGTFTVERLTSAPATDFKATTFPDSLERAVRVHAAIDERPGYAEHGLIAPSEKFVVAIREQYLEPRTESFVELFDVPSGQFTRRFKVPHVVSALALSPGERFLAVASPGRGGVRIYDLQHLDAEPVIFIAGEFHDAALLSFAREDRLLVGSKDLSRLLVFNLGRTPRSAVALPPEMNPADFLR